MFFTLSTLIHVSIPHACECDEEARQNKEEPFIGEGIKIGVPPFGEDMKWDEVALEKRRGRLGIRIEVA